MTTYTDELQREIERVTLKGNADKETMRKLASIIFRMDMRIQALEKEIVVDDKPVVVSEPVEEKAKETPKSSGKTIRPPQSKASASKKSDETLSNETSEV